MYHYLIIFVALIGCLVSPSRAAPDFATDIQPILAENCLACHGADKSEGGLRLDLEDEAFKATDSGEFAIVPNNISASSLLERVQSDDADVRMPPDSKRLEDSDIELLKRWIAAGAEWSEHWAYRPLDTRPPARVNQHRWIRTGVDRYVLARLEEASVQPSHEAPRAKLIRRLSYDLLGLPPSVESIDRFVNDKSPTAYERVVEEMLASPRFGERWGRHWLDKARYADSDGYEKDNNRPNAWRYRDWVIDAINADMPFDQFTIEQLAGDLLPNATHEQILATAFHRQTLTNTEGGTDQEQWRVAAVMDRTETLGTVWLGLTVGCARCHNHKYDQIAQAEYYQLYAFFNNADESNYGLPPTMEQLRTYNVKADEYEQTLATKRAEHSALASSGPSEGQSKENYEQNLAKLSDEIKKLEASPPKRPKFTVRVVSDRSASRRQTRILRRGEFKEPLDEVEAGTLTAIQTSRPDPAIPERLRLAHWLVDGNNPLVARVVVNQVWQHLFGKGLVTTPNDFGVRGDIPTHPRLLDYLASEYVRLGWSRKALIRQIVMSSTYRQSSNHRPELADIDPTNRLLYRQNRFRVEAEILRDITLAVSKLLCDDIGGPSVFPPMPSEAAAVSYANNFKWKSSVGRNRYRRGLYTYFKRTAPHPTLTTFDCPDANVTNVARNRSNTPIGALVLLNNEVYSEAAVAFARAAIKRSTDDTTRIEWAFRSCVARKPTDDELRVVTRLLNDSRQLFKSKEGLALELVGKESVAGISTQELASWTTTLRALLNLDEFITRD